MKKYLYVLILFLSFACSITIAEAKSVSQVCYYKSDDSKITFAVKAYDDGTSDAFLTQPYTKADFGEKQKYRASWKNVGTVLSQSQCKQYMKYTIKTGSNKIEFHTSKPSATGSGEYVLTNYKFLENASKCVYKGVNYRTADTQVETTVYIDDNSIFTYFNNDLNTSMDDSIKVGNFSDKIEYNFSNGFYDDFMTYFNDSSVGCPSVDTIQSYANKPTIWFSAVADNVTPDFGLLSSEYAGDVSADKILKSYTVNYMKDGRETNTVFYFRTYSNNQQKICIKIGSEAESCTVVESGKEAFLYTGTVEGTWTVFKVAKDEVDLLFQYETKGDYSTLKDPNPVYFNPGNYSAIYLSKEAKEGSSSSGAYDETLGAIYKNKICALKPYLQKLSPTASNYQLLVYDNIQAAGTNYAINKLPCDSWGFDYQYDCQGTNCNETLERDVEQRLTEIADHCNNVYNEYVKDNTNYNQRMRECQSFNTFYAQLASNNIVNDLSEDCSILSTDLKDKLIFILDLIKIAGPIIALGLGIIDFVKVLANGDADKEMKTAFKRFSIRVLCAALLFLIPIILAFLMDTFLGNQSGYDENNPFCNIVDWNE